MRARRSPTVVHLLLVMLAVVGVGAGGAIGVGGAAPAPAAASTPVTPQVVGGNEHTCALRSDGTVWCWGRNQSGQLGDGTRTSRPNPVQVAGLSGVTAIDAGEQHTCALLGDGTVRCWGYNFHGQLGDGGTTDSSAPVAVTGLSGVTRIATGGFHSCAVLTGGSVACWGNNDVGQIGRGNTTTPVPTPTAVSGLTSGVSDVTLGQAHSCALLAAGEARCWGFGGSGRLGDGETTSRTVPVPVLESGTASASPVVLSGITALSAGGAHTCALVTGSGGTVRCWGSNLFGQIGDGGTTDRANPFAGVTQLAGIDAVSAGGRHTCALVGDGSVLCWGANDRGQLGSSASLSPVIGLASVVQVSAGGGQTCAVVGDDTVRCWGAGDVGQVGDGETSDRSRQVTVLASGTAATSGPAFSVRVAAAPAGPVGPVGPSVGCAPATITVGTEVTCTVTGGDPGIDILWRAAVNPVIAEAGVTLDVDGRGEFSFTVPRLADGEELRVELVAWTAPVSLGVVGAAGPAAVGAAGGPVPTRVPAGDGGVAVAVGVAGAIGVAGMAGAAAVAGLLTLLLTTRIRSRRGHRS